MFGYSKKTFGCFIGYIVNDIAFVEVVDIKINKSFMEIPKDDLVSSKIVFKPGTIFEFTFEKFLGWEKVTFKPSKCGLGMTKEERDGILKKYEDKYGDL